MIGSQQLSARGNTPRAPGGAPGAGGPEVAAPEAQAAEKVPQAPSTTGEACISARDASEHLEDLVSALSRLSSRTRLRRSLIAPGSALSPTDAWLVRHLCERGPARMSALSAWQGVDRSTMTTQVHRLEKAGLVVRGTDPADRRAIIVCATAAGHAAHDANRAAATAVLTGILQSWTEAERQQLVASLDRFVAGVARYVDGPGDAPAG